MRETENVNVSTKALDDSIRYIKENFLNSLRDTGEEVLANYKNIYENFLKSDQTDTIMALIGNNIQNHNEKIDKLITDISEHLRSSQEEISSAQSVMEDVLDE